MADAAHGGWSRTRTALLAVLVLLLAAGAAIGGFAETRAVREHADPTPTVTTTPPGQLKAATAAPAPTPTPPEQALTAAAVRKALAGPLHDDGLGGRVLARVVDARTGAVLFDRAGSTAAAPASTAKLLTAAAALEVFEPSDTFTTKVVTDGKGTIVLVGGGDPTLTAATVGKQGPYGPSARIADLAAQLRKAKVKVGKIVVDGSLFAGPSVSPSWDPGDVPTDYASPITAIMVDGGRNQPGDYVRSDSPDLAAGQALAGALGADVPVVRGKAPAGARLAASVRSMPLADLIAQMLQQSDNVIAEVLGRQVALHQHRPGSFAGAVTAVRDVLSGAGIDTGATFHDASGLAPADRVSPAGLVAVLRAAAQDGSRLAPLVVGLPVAGWSGTLADRYPAAGVTGVAAGSIRAKTGTLTGVSTLAGLARTESGGLLAFAFFADRVPAGDPGNQSAEAALDALASSLIRKP